MNKISRVLLNILQSVGNRILTQYPCIYTKDHKLGYLVLKTV